MKHRYMLRAILALLIWAIVGCSTSTEPEAPLPGDVASYQYTKPYGKRFYEVTPVIATGSADTLFDSMWRTYTDPEGVFWAQSYRAIRRFKDSSGVPIKDYDTLVVNYRVGVRNDTLYTDQSMIDAVLVGPLTPGASWLLRGDSSVIVRVAGEEQLNLSIGPTATYHVILGGLGEDWWAPVFGRVQFEEINSSGVRVRAVLIALDHLP